jgi:hypothetical protein
MPYIRVSMMHARTGEEARVHELMDRLVAYYAEQPGYISGYRLEPTDPDGYLGRIGVWESDKDAERAAQTEFDLALRSQLNAAVDEHREYSFTGYEPGAPS